jgi:putative SOS response-associated peptidase YedK
VCGYFAINYLKLAELVVRFSLDDFPNDDPSLSWGTARDYYPSRGNAHAFIPTIHLENGRRTLSLFRWDLVPGWWSQPFDEKKFASFNARSESLNDKPVFKNAWRKRQRCLIPATSFYEWPEKKLLLPTAKRAEHEVSIRDERVFAMAGIWDSCVTPDSETLLRSCAVITTAANEAVARIPHSRMPVILPKASENAWLDPETALETAFAMLRPYPADATLVEIGHPESQAGAVHA